MRNKIFNRNTLWCSDTESLADEIASLCKDSKYYGDTAPLSDKQARVVREVTDIRLSEFTLNKDIESKNSSLVFRILSLVLSLILMLSLPILCVKWLITGKYYLSSKSKVGVMVDDIYRRGGF